MKYIFIALSLALITLFLSACGSSTPTPELPVIKSFNATPDTLGMSGGEVTLRWEVTGATSLDIDQEIGSVTETSIKVSLTESKTFTLTAHNAAGSATKSTTVTVMPAALIVNPASGSDNNDGTTEATAFKTIHEALSVAKTGQMVQLKNGNYSTASGEDFSQPLAIADGVSMVGEGDETVLIFATPPDNETLFYGFNFTGSGGLSKMKLIGSNYVMLEASNGLITLRDLTFQNGGVQFKGNAQITFRDSSFDDAWMNVSDNARASLETMVFSNSSSFSASENGQLTVNNVSTAETQIALWDNASLKGRKLSMYNYQPVCAGSPYALVTGGGSPEINLNELTISNSTGALDLRGSPRVTLTNSKFSNNGNHTDCHMRTISLYEGEPTLVQSEITGNLGSIAAIYASTGSVLELDNVAILSSYSRAISSSGVVRIEASTIQNNTEGGIWLGQGANADISNSTIATNTGGAGIECYCSLKMRVTTVHSNQAGILLPGTQNVYVDLGTTSSSGGNTIQNNVQTNLKMTGNPVGVITVQAVGNKWSFNQQGASAQGFYSSSLQSGPVTGLNYILEDSDHKVQF
jgi:hypothetical protein